MNSYDGAACACGSTWYRLEDDEHRSGVVTLDENGMVTGFAGTPVCVECGEVWQRGRDRLRVVR